MRLWHQALLTKLPRQQILGQHREICALRGLGWGKKHSVVNYVFEYDPAYLIAYHFYVMQEMINRGYKPDQRWLCYAFRGEKAQFDWTWADYNILIRFKKNRDEIIYPEHNEKYYDECIENLRKKGITIK